jgi:hypothetical protein
VRSRFVLDEIRVKSGTVFGKFEKFVSLNKALGLLNQEGLHVLLAGLLAKKAGTRMKASSCKLIIRAKR